MSDLTLQWDSPKYPFRHTGVIDCNKGFREFYVQARDMPASIKSGFDLYEVVSQQLTLKHLAHGESVAELKQLAEKIINQEWPDNE